MREFTTPLFTGCFGKPMDMTPIRRKTGLGLIVHPAYLRANRVIVNGYFLAERMPSLLARTTNDGGGLLVGFVIRQML